MPFYYGTDYLLGALEAIAALALAIDIILNLRHLAEPVRPLMEAPEFPPMAWHPRAKC
jgi:hypothetical protein